MLREALDDIGVPVLGALRRGDLPVRCCRRRRARRGAGGCTARSTATRAVRRLGEAVAAAVDLDRLLALARSAPRLTADAWSATEPRPAPTSPRRSRCRHRRPVVALAGGPGRRLRVRRDGRAADAPPAPTSSRVDPLRDEALPAGHRRAGDRRRRCPRRTPRSCRPTAGCCIAVAELARAGRPVVAEGAGLLWLAREFDGRPMCGVLDAVGRADGPDRGRLPGGDRARVVAGGPARRADGRVQAAPRRASPRAPGRRRPGPGAAARRRASSGGGCTPRS